MCSLSQNLQRLRERSAGFHLHTPLQTSRCACSLAGPSLRAAAELRKAKDRPKLFMFLKRGPPQDRARALSSCVTFKAPALLSLELL